MMCNYNNRLIFALGMTVAVAGAMAAVMYSATFIPPYVHDKAHERVQCTVLSSVKSANACCDATETIMSSCNDVIPCYQIVVSYKPPGGAINVTGHLYYNYQSVAYQKNNHNCSVYLCPTTYAEATGDSKSFIASKGIVGQSYPCFRNPANPLEVLPAITSLLNIVLIATIASLAAILGCIVGCLGYKGHFPQCQEEWEKEVDKDALIGDKKVAADGSSVTAGCRGVDGMKGALNGEVAHTAGRAQANETGKQDNGPMRTGTSSDSRRKEPMMSTAIEA